MEQKHYETIFILSPTLSNEQTKETVDKYRAFLIDKQAVIQDEEAIGLKTLA